MAGSPYVAVGRVGRPHGLRGEVRVDTLGTLPHGLEGYSRFYLEEGRGLREVHVESWRLQGRRLLVRFSGCTDPESARRLTHATLYVTRAEMPPLAEGEYYHADLLGCRVVDEAGGFLGHVVDVFSVGPHDVAVVSSGRSEWMLPLTLACVPTLDLARGEIRARVPEGLRE